MKYDINEVRKIAGLPAREASAQREPMSYWLFNVDEEGYATPSSFEEFQRLVNNIKRGDLIGSNKAVGNYRVAASEEISIAELPSNWSQKQVEEWGDVVAGGTR